MNNQNLRGDDSASKLKIIGFNSNSIGKQPKRRQVLKFLYKKNPDLLIVVDTRIAKNIENTVKEEWGGQVLFSSFDSQSRGVALFIKKDLPIKILDKFSDDNGNLLSVLIEFENKRLLIEGIYGPNQDCPEFYENEVFQKIQIWNPSHSIFVGDWNIAIDQNLDTLNYQNVGNPNARLELIRKISEHNLIDIYRDLNPTEKKFTWKQWGSHKFARLDYFLVSDSLLPYISKASISPSCFSDHSPIELEVDFSKFSRGRGFWKFNNSLIKDSEYLELIQKVIKRVTTQYAIIEGDADFFLRSTPDTIDAFLEEQTPESLQALNLSINPELFLDTLLMEIRGATIKYSSRKKKDRKAAEQLLMHEIEILESQLQNRQTSDQQLQEELSLKKDAFENLIKHEAEGAFVRSRAKYKLEGEKPSKLFCGLEKHNGVQRYVSQLLVKQNDGRDALINEQNKVENEIYKFYRNLFTNKDDLLQNQSIENFLGPGCQNIPKLSEQQKQNMEGKLSLDEMTKYLKKCKNNVAPGSSGFTFDFYKFFWRNLKQFIIRAVDYAFVMNRLAKTQSLGLINIIPKGDKDKRFLSNWRPLCLLNSLYKLISGALAERIKPSLETLIHPDQKGFVPGRYIGEVVRTTYDIIQYAKENDKVGLLMLIDFEKAYDSISFNFINKCLNFFNFGPEMIKWVEILLHNFNASINHCGNISKTFSIGRGCRQGDPIASYLFILSIEILAHKLRHDQRVAGFDIGNSTHLLEIYADDMTIFLRPDSNNLRTVVEILDSFYNLSGLKISVSKTKAIWFGVNHNSNLKLCPDISLVWVKTFTLLGINFDNNLEAMENNFWDKIENIEKMLSCWFYRYLTPYGKVTIIRTLALSQLSHIALVIPNPTKQMFKRIESIFFRFLWNNKSEKVCREDAKLPEKLGGLNVPDVEKFWLSFKFSWLRRSLITDSFWPKILSKQILISHGTLYHPCELLTLGPALLAQIGKKLKNKFWCQVLNSTVNMAEGFIFSHPEKLTFSSLWYNPWIRRNNRVIKPADFPELANTISCLADLFYPCTNNIMSREDLMNRYNLEIGENKYIDIRYCINLALQKMRLPREKLLPAVYPLKPVLIDVALSTSKGCGTYYKCLTSKQNLKNKMQVRENKWHQELNSLFSIQFWEKARRLCASICYENPSKWLQFQILRNSLQTNYIVSHFLPNVGPECQFGCQMLEKTSHIFWTCPFVTEFLNDVFALVCSTGLVFTPTRVQFLFGFLDVPYNDPKNMLVLITKRFIWISKFRTGSLSIVGFKNYLKTVLSEYKVLYNLQNKNTNFNVWNDLFSIL